MAKIMSITAVLCGFLLVGTSYASVVTAEKLPLGSITRCSPVNCNCMPPDSGTAGGPLSAQDACQSRDGGKPCKRGRKTVSCGMYCRNEVANCRAIHDPKKPEPVQSNRSSTDDQSQQ